jgi:hypothetical protein
MRWSDATTPPTTCKLREFAIVSVIALVVLAAWRLWVSDEVALAAFYALAAVIVGLVGAARPRWLAPVFTAWLMLVFPIAWVVSHLVLALLYFGLITPLAVAFRICRRDVLDRAWPARQDSYWRDKPAAEQLDRHFRQF